MLTKKMPRISGTNWDPFGCAALTGGPSYLKKYLVKIKKKHPVAPKMWQCFDFGKSRSNFSGGAKN